MIRSLFGSSTSTIEHWLSFGRQDERPATYATRGKQWPGPHIRTPNVSRARIWPLRASPTEIPQPGIVPLMRQTVQKVSNLYCTDRDGGFVGRGVQPRR